MLKNVRVTAFTASESLRDNQEEEGNYQPTPNQIRIKSSEYLRK